MRSGVLGVADEEKARASWEAPAAPLGKARCSRRPRWTDSNMCIGSAGRVFEGVAGGMNAGLKTREGFVKCGAEGARGRLRVCVCVRALRVRVGVKGE